MRKLKQKYKIGLCGNLSGTIPKMGGQTIKTRNILEVLEKEFGKEEIIITNTYKWNKKPFKIIRNTLSMYFKCDNIVMMPAENGLRLFGPLFTLLKKIKKRKIFYVVIGGWLHEYTKKHKMVKKCLKSYDGIFVETNSMINNLEKQGFDKVYQVPNFKNITPIHKDNIMDSYSAPFSVCTMSRVMYEKGIEDAINAVIEVNNKLGKTEYKLYIYGQIEANYEKRFKKIIDKSPDYISYVGVVPSNETVDVLKNYYLLLFPTFYEGEGFPGTLLDAFAAGVPVIATDWHYNREVLPEKCGYIYNSKEETLSTILQSYIENDITEVKRNCLCEAEKYIPSKASRVLIERLR